MASPVLPDEKTAELREKTLPLVEWLAKNMHPHVTLIVTPTGYELLEGVASHETAEFLRD